MLATSALCLATAARAQIGFSASLDSDYRFRGLSLSDGRPALSLAIAYDHDSGAYAGVSAIGEETAHSGARMLGFIEYAGYVGRSKTGPNWDVGVTNGTVTEYSYPTHNLNYTEVYVGLIMKGVSTHLYYSPNYFGGGVGTLYADLDGAFRPAPGWRLFGHVGVLTPLSGPSSPGRRNERYDLRAGVARTFGAAELHLSWTDAAPAVVYPAEHVKTHGAVVLGAAYFF